MITPDMQRRLYILAMIAAAISLLFAVLAAHAETVTTFHDKSGFVVGKARTEDGTTTFYDAHGRVVGTARTQHERR